MRHSPLKLILLAIGLCPLAGCNLNSHLTRITDTFEFRMQLRDQQMAVREAELERERTELERLRRAELNEIRQQTAKMMPQVKTSLMTNMSQTFKNVRMVVDYEHMARTAAMYAKLEEQNERIYQEQLTKWFEDQAEFHGWHKQDELLVRQNHGMIGQLVRGTEVKNRVTQLWGNSTSFDYSPFHGSVDFVFIDANRQYEYVLSDSRNARAMLKPSGILVWHDYNYADSVTRAVDEFCSDQGLKCRNVSQMTVAFTLMNGE